MFNFAGGKIVGEKEIDALLIQPGDVLKVLPGAKMPADGLVVWGSSYVNESMVTGESVPASKEVNSSVIGGTINLHGSLHIQANKVGSNTVLSQIISLVETAQMSKAPIQKFADFVSSSLLFFFTLCFLRLCQLVHLILVFKGALTLHPQQVFSVNNPLPKEKKKNDEGRKKRNKMLAMCMPYLIFSCSINLYKAASQLSFATWLKVWSYPGIY